MAASRKNRDPKRAGDLVAAALKDLGLPSRRISDRLRRVWAMVADPAWADRVRLRSFDGGILEVGVDSAPLREELVQFHRERLLEAVQTALGEVPVVGLRFVMDGSANR
jgi:hypothetical protein